MGKKIIFLILILLCIICPVYKVEANVQRNFVTLVYPVRGRNLWQSPNLSQLDNLFLQLQNYSFASTWLFQYDALSDKEVVVKFKKDCPNCEFGLFLEISERLATNALVSYKGDAEDWARPDKIFMSGYKLLERERLIDQSFRAFKEKFGYYPKSIGAWYIDSYSLQYIVSRYHPLAFVSVADQFDTDGQKYWGKPWGFPYYPGKFDSLSPGNGGDKLNVVSVQWAQRDPTLGYEKSIYASRHSFQANDYRNLGRTTDYFSHLVSVYSGDSANPFSQITIGLEVGQELAQFQDEHLRQLEILAQKSNLEKVTLSNFAQWYKKEYPNSPPISRVSDGKTTWINSPCYRLGYKTLSDNGYELFDIRAYDPNSISPDYLHSDPSHFLSREVTPLLSTLEGDKSIIVQAANKLFLADKFQIGETSYDFSVSCTERSNTMGLKMQLLWIRFKEKFSATLGLLKSSLIEGKRIIGIQIRHDALVGFWQGKGVGVYRFPDQILLKFQTPAGLVYN